MLAIEHGIRIIASLPWALEKYAVKPKLKYKKNNWVSPQHTRIQSSGINNTTLLYHILLYRLEKFKKRSCGGLLYRDLTSNVQPYTII